MDCFWGHKWSAWVTSSRQLVNMEIGLVSQELYQYRLCLKCNYRQEKMKLF